MFSKLLIFLLFINVMVLNGQNTIDIKKIFSTPGRSVDFPLHYDLFIPSYTILHWPKDSKSTIDFNGPTVRDGLNSQTFGDNQRIKLDTSTTILNPKNLTGTWRSISIRYIEISDSISFLSHQAFRHDSILATLDNVEYIMMFKDNKLCVYSKSIRKAKYRKSVYDFQLVDGHILNFSKSRIFGGTQFIGIDKDDIMIMQGTEVISRYEDGKYRVVITRIGQMFFERISNQTGGD